MSPWFDIAIAQVVNLDIALVIAILVVRLARGCLGRNLCNGRRLYWY
jgi:hypothetical protein